MICLLSPLYLLHDVPANGGYHNGWGKDGNLVILNVCRVIPSREGICHTVLASWTVGNCELESGLKKIIIIKTETSVVVVD